LNFIFETKLAFCLQDWRWWWLYHEAQEANLGNGDKPHYFQCKALVHSVKSANANYKACPQPECNKKLIDQDNGQFRCEKCNADHPNFK
jgi:replication factor A1